MPATVGVTNLHQILCLLQVGQKYTNAAASCALRKDPKGPCVNECIDNHQVQTLSKLRNQVPLLGKPALLHDCSVAAAPAPWVLSSSRTGGKCELTLLHLRLISSTSLGDNPREVDEINLRCRRVSSHLPPVREEEITRVLVLLPLSNQVTMLKC